MAGVGAGILPLAASVSVGFLGSVGLLGVAVLVVVGVSYYVALIDLKGGNPINLSSYTVQCALFPGMAAAGVVLTLRYDLIAAAGLILLVSAYDSGDFLIGSGSRRRWVGPAMGMIAVMVMAFAISSLRLPPFVLPQALYLGGDGGRPVPDRPARGVCGSARCGGSGAGRPSPRLAHGPRPGVGARDRHHHGVATLRRRQPEQRIAVPRSP